MGLSVDYDTVLHWFQEGGEEWDPALLWFVDVRGKKKRRPADAEEVRQWFQQHTAVVQTGLRTLAQELRAGMDVDDWPLQWTIPNAPREKQLKIVCSAVRRLDALEIARVLTGIADNWSDYLAQLQPEESSLR
jgi:hypothetical protein